MARRAGQDEQLHTDSQPSKASTAPTRTQRTAADRKEGYDLDDRSSSSSASQHFIPLPRASTSSQPAWQSPSCTPGAMAATRVTTEHLLPSHHTSSAEAENNTDAQMRDIANGKRSLDTPAYINLSEVEPDIEGDAAMPPPPSSSSGAATDGGGGKRLCSKAPSSCAEGAAITVATVSTPCPSSTQQPPPPRSREAALEQEIQRLRADLDSMRTEMALLRGQLVQQMRPGQSSATAPPTSTLPAPALTIPMDTSPPSASAATTAAVRHSPQAPASPLHAAATGAAGQRPRKNALLSLRGRTVEPTADQLELAGLPTTSTTDLVLTVRFAPPSAGKMRRRVHFPSHETASLEERIAIGSQLQDANGLQIAPPRIPSFVMLPNGALHPDRDQLMAKLSLSSPEHRYLHAWRQAEQMGDEFDLLQHTFADRECVEGWAKLFSPSTQAFHPRPDGDGLQVVLYLGFTDSLITEAVRRTLDAHAVRIQEEKAGRAGAQSPTPSTASTASSSSSSSSEPHRAGKPSRSASLSPCALASTVSVSAGSLRYVCMTVSNWPREHPTELCGGDEQLLAFMHQHATHLRVLLHQEHGSTSSSTMVIGQKQHLAELVALQGQCSPEHGISKPLHLNAAVHMMGAQTCTFCWCPGHGAARCPRRHTAAAPGLSIPKQAACRHCYSFEHHAAACRQSASVICKLCEETGHSTSACAFFKPSKRPLRDFLNPAAALAAAKRKAQSAAAVQQPAQILSADQVAAAQPWKQASTVSSSANTVPSATAAVMAQVIHSTYITHMQLDAALAPILAMLTQLTQPTMMLPPSQPTAMMGQLPL